MVADLEGIMLIIILRRIISRLVVRRIKLRTVVDPHRGIRMPRAVVLPLEDLLPTRTSHRARDVEGLEVRHFLKGLDPCLKGR